VETRGIEISPSGMALAAGVLKPLGRKTSPAAGTAIILIVAEMRKGKVCLGAHGGRAAATSAGNGKGLEVYQFPPIGRRGTHFAR
jgi:hypothetical protein